jgi:hypothetical protein
MDMGRTYTPRPDELQWLAEAGFTGVPDALASSTGSPKPS